LAIPAEFLPDVDALPRGLRALLDAELDAGNQIVRHDRSIPAPPVGAYLELARRVTTRARASGDGLSFRDFSKFGYPGSFTDDAGVFFLLEPFAPELEVDMDAIRDAQNHPVYHPKIIRSDPNTPLGRFERSMVVDYEKWHDGVGYDMDALNASTGKERSEIEWMILDRGAKDWRDVEALAALGTPAAVQILKEAMRSADPEIRMAVTRYASRIVPDAARVRSLVRALQTATLYAGLSQALDEAEQFHPKEVVEELLRGVLQRDGETAVLFAAMLMYIHGKAACAFDFDHRPFFLRFNTVVQTDREAAFHELCGQIGVDASKYL
jgi:hypothetical protein